MKKVLLLVLCTLACTWLFIMVGFHVYFNKYLSCFTAFCYKLDVAYSSIANNGIYSSKPIWNLPDNNNFTGCVVSDYFGHGLIYNCSQSNSSSSSSLRVIMVTIAMNVNLDSNDSIWRIFMNNHRNYALIHGYTYIMITSPFTNINKTYSHKQKPYIFYHVINHTLINNTDYLLIHDLDILFLNCCNNIENIINYTSHINIYRNMNHTLNLVFSADRHGPNSGVLLFKYSKWSIDFINNWYYMMKHYRFDRKKFVDQNAFSALIFGFHINGTNEYPNNHNDTYFIDLDPRFNFDNYPKNEEMGEKGGPKVVENDIAKWYNKYLNNNVSSRNVAVIPSVYLNHVVQSNKEMDFVYRYQLPFVAHFAGKKHYDDMIQFEDISTCYHTVSELMQSIAT